MLANVSVPKNLTAEESEAIVEFDSHLQMVSKLTDGALLETVVGVNHSQSAFEQQEDSALDNKPKESLLAEQLHVVAFPTSRNCGFEQL